MAGVSLRGKQTSWWFHPTSLKAWITASIPQWKGTANWNILKPRIRSIKIRILMVVKAPHCCWLTRLLLVLKSPGPLKNVCHTGLPGSGFRPRFWPPVRWQKAPTAPTSWDEDHSFLSDFFNAKDVYQILSNTSDIHWWVVDLPVWKIYEFVTWDHYYSFFPIYGLNQIHVPNHQTDITVSNYGSMAYCSGGVRRPGRSRPDSMGMGHGWHHRSIGLPWLACREN